MVKIRQVLRFVNQVRLDKQEPQETTSLFTKALMTDLYLWADADELPSKSLWFKFVNFLTNCGHIILAAVMLANLIVAKVHWVTRVENCCIFLGAIMISTKALFYWWKRGEITQVIRRVNEKNWALREKGQRDPVVRQLRRRFYLQEMLITIPFLFNADFLILVMILKPFFSRNPSLPCPALFPFDTTPFGTGFWVAYVYQSVNILLMSTMYALSDTTIGNNYNQIVLNFDVLNHELRQLGHQTTETGDESMEKQSEYQSTIKRKLIEIIDEFQSLTDLVEFCNEFLFSFFMFLIAIITANFCLIIFSASRAVNNNFMEFLQFFMYFAYMVTIFLYWCWLGNRVMYQSSELATSAYFSNWLAGDVQFRKMLYVLMMRTQRPVYFHAKPFYKLSLATFVSVMAKAYQFFAVLKDLN